MCGYFTVNITPRPFAFNKVHAIRRDTNDFRNAFVAISV